jgi:prepilin-type N-terminal cleavage/methylation domain-containing protein
MNFRKGFTFIEILLVVGIGAIVFAFSAPLSLRLYRTQLLDEATSGIVNALQRAKHNAVLQKNDSDWGVKISNVNHNYVLFQGVSYDDRIAEYDEVYNLLSQIEVSGDWNEVVFSKLNGEPNDIGTTTLTYSPHSTAIVIQEGGVISKVSVADSGGGEEAALTAPGAPTIGTATAGNATSTVTFSAPASDGGSAITSYTVTSSPGDITGTGASSPITVTGLTNETAYTFTVTATNAIGVSISSAASNSVTPTAVPSNGLVSYWSFDGNALDPISGNNGTPYGDTLLTIGVGGVADTAYSFDGIGDYIQGDAQLVTAYPVTLSAWIKTEGTSATFVWTGDKDNTAVYEAIELDYAGDGTAITRHRGGNDRKCDSDIVVNDGDWHYIVGIAVSSVQDKIYVDGILRNTCALSSSNIFAVAHDRWATGYSADSTPGNYLNGLIDNVRLYDRALSAEEILAIYDEEKPPATVPGAPTIGTATAGNATSSVAFTAPVSNGGSAITSYTVTSSPEGITASGASSPITVTGLTNGTAYTFTVTATNAIGVSASSSASNSVTPTAIPTNGLVSYWSFNGNANDSVGSNNGTVSGATLTTGVKGLSNTAYSFNGTDSYIYVPDSATLDQDNDFTINLWAKLDPGAYALDGNPVLIQKEIYRDADAGDAAYRSNYYITVGDTGAVNVGFEGTASTSESSLITEGSWRMYTFSLNESLAKAYIYLDGVQVVETPYIIDPDGRLNNAPVVFGRYSYYYTFAYHWLKGSLDQTRLYSRALSAQEILDIYNEEKPDATVPDAPTIGTATAGNATSTVSFTAPFNGRSNITGYTVTSSPGGITASGASSPITISGLTNGTAYTFSVTATNAIGVSTSSSASNSVTPADGSFSDTFGGPNVSSNWATTSLASAVITSGKLVTESNQNTWANYGSAAIYTLGSPLTGNFTAQANLEWVGRTTDLSQQYLYLYGASGSVFAGMDDSWGSNNPQFTANINGTTYGSGMDNLPASGSMDIKIERVGTTINIYKDNVLKLTTTFAGTFTQLRLTNTRLTNYNGKTAKWDYVSIQ